MAKAKSKKETSLVNKHVVLLSTLVIVGFITFVISLLLNSPKVKGASVAKVDYISTLYKLPQKTGADELFLTSQAVIVMDTDSKVILYEKNADKRLLPASTTKIVTALVALDAYESNQVLTVDILKTEGSKMGLVTGEQITVESLLKGLLITSANDAAEVLAANFPGGRQVFIEKMNKKSESLNLTNTSFTNPSGFDDFNHRSTARDLVRAADAAMKHELFAEIVSLKEETVSSIDGQHVHKLVATNHLLGEIEGVTGVKTGWTQEAQENLVTFYSKDGHNLMIAVLGSADRFGDTKSIIEWVNNNYSWVSVDSVGAGASEGN